jgi:uncharacterized membrane protein YeaQ/YmgE (transglycosylase-associated protein family)
MFRILGALISGFIIGILARWLYPGSVHMHMGTTILLGIGGSLLADAAPGAAARVRARGCSPRSWGRWR